MKLNATQARHLAVTLQTLGLGQLAAFGYTGVRAEHWVVVVLSLAFLIAFEAAALLILRDAEDST